MSTALTPQKKRGAPARQGNVKLLSHGHEALNAVIEAIEAAKKSIRLEMYIVRSSPIAEKVVTALTAACGRGVRVRFLIDAVGSVTLSETFLAPIKGAGGEYRWFKRMTFGHLAIRNHRKLLVCDDQVAIVGGFNLAPEYHGDGVKSGWRDIGCIFRNAMVPKLAASFDALFALGDLKPQRFLRLRKSVSRQKISTPDGDILLGGPGRSRNEIVMALLADLRRAQNVKIISAYFLPSRRLRGALRQVVRKGGKVELILAGKSDIIMSQLAARHLYQRLLRFGIEIYEYQPQILHSKLFIIDKVVYVGSANMDRRSLYINYELLCRFHQGELAEEARKLFGADLQLSRKIEVDEWRRSRTFCRKLVESWAYFILARLDPHLAKWEWKTFARLNPP